MQESFEALIDEAESVLAPVIRQTPVEVSPVLSQRLGVPVLLKLECLQLTGSFKIRGALFALSRLRASGADTVATCSAGNHGLGVAWAARHFGLRARIHVPASVDSRKATSLAALGADLVRSEFAGFDDTEVRAQEIAAREGLPWISAYDQPEILAANGGTLMREVRRQVPDVETLVCPVGGGGLSGGTITSDSAPARLVAAQTAASPALAMSLERGEAVTRLEASETLAGGLEGGIGITGFRALKERVGQVLLASESDIAAGMRWVLEHHGYLIEPSSAVAVAACLSPEVEVRGPTVVVLTGRNVAVETVRKILA